MGLNSKVRCAPLTPILILLLGSSVVLLELAVSVKLLTLVSVSATIKLTGLKVSNWHFVTAFTVVMVGAVLIHGATMLVM